MPGPARPPLPSDRSAEWHSNVAFSLFGFRFAAVLESILVLRELRVTGVLDDEGELLWLALWFGLHFGLSCALEHCTGDLGLGCFGHLGEPEYCTETESYVIGGLGRRLN